MQLFFSNRVENLFEQLQLDLFRQGESIFAERLVVVPSPAVKSWLTEELATKYGVAMGIKVCYLEETLSRLRESEKKKPSAVALSLAIEDEIQRALKEQLNPEIWFPLWGYLGVADGSSLSLKGERRLIALSETLASLFQQYGIYGAELIREWEEKRTGGWQGALWRQLFDPSSGWSYPIREFQQPIASFERETALYLFSLSYLSKIHHNFLKRVAEKVSVNYYILSPCQEFWSDILTDRESGRLQSYWKRRGVSEEQSLVLEEYLSDRNPLLANYGVIGREMAKTLEESEFQSEAHYSERDDLTLLSSIQSDLVEMQVPSKTMEYDHSIEIHRALNPLREIEVVRDAIFKLIDERGFLPEEIIVMAPHIGDYAPFIKTTFEFSPADYQIMDLTSPQQHSAIEAFMKLLDLPGARFDVVSIIELIENPAFGNEFRFTQEETNTISTWLRELGVKWGFDGNYKDEVMRQDHGCSTAITETNYGTFSDAIGRLLLALADDKEELISSSESDLLGRLISLLESLKRDLAPIKSRKQHSVIEWVEYLKGLSEYYLKLDEEAEIILKRELGQLVTNEKEISVGFTSIHKRLIRLFEKQHGGFRESHLHAIRFCSMLPMRAIPARAIFLIGMEEGPFPKKEINLSLNECLKHPSKVEFCPTVADYDRFLFLEALLSAREQLTFTFLGISKEDGKEQQPNPLVQELVHYVKKSYGISLPVYNHPETSFDEPLFYDPLHYQEACAFYSKETKVKHQFLKGVTTTNSCDSSVDLSELAHFAKNPLRPYFNHTLNLFLKGEEEELSTEENFALTPLHKYQLVKLALEQPLEVVLEEAEDKRFLPPGIFKEVEKKRLCEEINKIDLPEKLLKITLSEDCDCPFEEAPGEWVVPPLVTKVGVSIVGTLREVAEKGLLAYQKADVSGIIRSWPTYLVFHEAVKRYQLPVQLSIQFLKDGKDRKPFFEEAGPYLDEFCSVYKMSKEKVSHLFPEFVQPMLAGDVRALQKSIDQFLPSFDPYVTWLWNENNLPNALKVSEQHKEEAERLYGDVLSHWGKS